MTLSINTKQITKNYDIYFVYALLLPNGDPFYYGHSKNVAVRYARHQTSRQKPKGGYLTTRQVIEGVKATGQFITTVILLETKNPQTAQAEERRLIRATQLPLTNRWGCPKHLRMATLIGHDVPVFQDWPKRQPSNNPVIKIVFNVSTKVAELLAQEAKENKRSRKSQIEVALEKHAERYEKRTLENGN